MSLTTRFTTFVNEERSGSLPTFNWTNTSNVSAEDNQSASYTGNYATSFGPDPTDYLVCTDIATKIPTGAVVLGITVRIKKTAASDLPDFTDSRDSVVQLVYGSSGGVATVVGANKADTTTLWSYTLTNSTYGGSLDTWSWAFSSDPTYLNDSSFGIKIGATINGSNSQKNAGFIGIDYVEITFNFDGTLGPSGLPTQEQAPVQRLTPGKVSVRESSINSSNQLSILDRLSATYSISGNIGSNFSSNLPTIHKLVPTAKFYPLGLPTAQNIGSHLLTTRSWIYPSSIASAQAMGAHRLYPLAKIYPNGLNTGQNIGNIRLFSQAYIYHNSINTGQAFGVHRLFAQYNIYHSSITSLQNTPNAHRLFPGNVNVYPPGISSEQRIGSHTLYAQAFIYPNGLSSSDRLGTHRLYPVAYIYPPSTDSTNNISGNHRLFARANIYHIAPFDKPELGWSDGAHGVYLDARYFIYVNNHAPGQPGYYPFTSPPISTTHNVTINRFIFPSGNVSGDVLGIHSLGRTFGAIYPPGTVTNEIDPIHQLTQEKNIYPPPISDNNKDDGLGLHELLWKRKTINFLNSIYSPAYEVGYFDCVALTRDVNNDPQYDLSYNSINTNYLFSIDNITLNYGQQADASPRYAGEGAMPNTFNINVKDYSLSFKLPIKIESWGYVDNVFAALYDFCMQGYKGTPTSYVGRFTSTQSSIGATNAIKIDNISDFITLSSGTTVYIRTDNNSNIIEGLELDYVSKSEKVVYFTGLGSTQSHQTNISYLWAKPETDDREPSFSLFSLREGLISGCMVDKISFTITPGNSVIASVDLKFTTIDREYQKNILANFNSLVANINKRKPNYLLSGAQFRLYNTTSDAGYFNLGLPIDRRVFRGFQETDIKNFEINEITIEISNNLKSVHTLNAKSSNDKENANNNLKPYAFYSDGRTISGTITYSSPIKPWLFAEKLSGPSSINNGGIIFDFGPFKMNLPQIVWSPTTSESGMEQVHQKKVSWTAVTNKFVFDPYLEPTGIY